MTTRHTVRPKLPRALLDQVEGASGPRKSRGDKDTHSRRDRRKTERQQLKARRPVKELLHPRVHASAQIRNEEDEDIWSGLSDKDEESPAPPRKHPKTQRLNSQEPSRKRRRLSNEAVDELPKLSKSVQKKLGEDDEEIAKWEKKLRIKSKKLPKSFEDEGLGGLLGNLDDVNDVAETRQLGEKSEGDEQWLQNKRRMGGQSGENFHKSTIDDSSRRIENGSHRSVDENLESWNEGGMYEGHNSAQLSDDVIVDSDLSDDILSEDEESVRPDKPRRENPYVAPVSATDVSETKYVPPSRRSAPASDEEVMTRLLRQLQGAINKLSESNLLSIVREIEKLYASNARQHVHFGLVDLILTSVCVSAALSLNYLVLHAAFAAALYRIIGADFGAQCVEKVITTLHGRGNQEQNPSGQSKQSLNLFTFLSNLYNFGVVSSNLIFDYVRELLAEITETNTELLLRILRVCGYQLRQDDSGSLKEIAMVVQKNIASMHGAQVSVRTKFMVEEINRLKDNRTKQHASGVGDIGELVTRYRKILGSLNNRHTRARQPLTFGLRDVHDSEKTGKWWLVGASWRGRHNNDTASELSPTKGTDFLPDQKSDGDTLEPDLVAISRQHQMNTSVRRAIFVTLMSASDHSQAHSRLLKLNLTRSQEQQIPHVLLHCTGVEPTFNLYYLLVARKLCSNYKTRMAFQFALWDLFKRMCSAENDENERSVLGSITATAVVNYAKLYSGLVETGAVPITVLKPLKFRSLSGQQSDFVEVMLTELVGKAPLRSSRASQDSLEKIFAQAKEVKDYAVGLRRFVKHRLVDARLAVTEKQKARLAKRSKELAEVLRDS